MLAHAGQDGLPARIREQSSAGDRCHGKMCPTSDPRSTPPLKLHPHVEAEGAEGKTKNLCRNRRLRLKDRTRDPG
eukprot:3403352-Pyramimonas_sp.AAC.1